jgi:hypothetical protein
MEESQNRSMIIVVVVIVIVLGIVAYFVAGAQGVAGIFNFLKWSLIGVTIIGLAVWAVWFLFIRKVRDDRVALNAARIVEQAKLTKPEYLEDLWMSGDIDHPQVKLGKIIGYTRIKNVLDEEEDVYCFKKSPWPFNMFEEAKSIRVNPKSHTDNIGDVIIQGISVVSHGGFLYVNQQHLDMERIDRTIKTEVIRQYTMDVLRDIKIITDAAVGLDESHLKQLESRSLLKIPSRVDPAQQQQQQQQGGNQ